MGWNSIRTVEWHAKRAEVDHHYFPRRWTGIAGAFDLVMAIGSKSRAPMR